MWDGTGLCAYAKRLEQGRFACLWRDGEESALELARSELDLFLEGSKLVGKVPQRSGTHRTATTHAGPATLDVAARIEREPPEEWFLPTCGLVAG